MIESGSAEVAAGNETRQYGFVHSASIYHSQQEFLQLAGRFVGGGLALDEAVLLAAPPETLALLHRGLYAGGDPPADVSMIDITEEARNPSRFMAMQCAFIDEHPDQRVRIVSQLAWPGRTDEEFVACSEHEALVNEAMDGYPATSLCLYDASRLGEGVLADARATHPLLWESGALAHSPLFAPSDVLERCNQPLAASPGAVTYMVRKSADLRPARSFAVDYAGWMGLSQESIEDLQLVATELATNSLMYTGGACRLAFWKDDGHVVCEARDTGRFDDPMVGRMDPGPCGPASRGLYLVNAISDLVRTHTTRTGTTIQAYVRFEPAVGPAG